MTTAIIDRVGPITLLKKVEKLLYASWESSIAHHSSFNYANSSLLMIRKEWTSRKVVTKAQNMKFQSFIILQVYF